ncbi:ATP-binding protein [Halomonas koreensis]|uniref:ATP-binding protein n=1 Tax=Halomonas koreensis TaxID=245385 RepID=A0ABU1G4W2_9GAMM|nr:ATP-binding protein [Halomonas koreensis]MDR5867951.1 ATP-binding protein [Halomonas koreensis]
MTATSIRGAMQTRPAQCERHGEYESVLLNLGGQRWTGCPHCSAETIEQHQAERDASQAEDLRRLRGQAMFEASGVPRRLQGATLKSYVSDSDEQDAAHRQVCEYAKGLAGHLETGDGLVLMGNMGTGKTHLAVGLIRYATRSLAVPARYVTAPALFSRVRASYGGNGESEAEILDELVAAPLLVIDEIGVGKGSDNELNLTYSLLGQRYDACRPTVIITNLMSEDLRAWLGERVVDRLRETSPVVLFNWESYRGRS